MVGHRCLKSVHSCYKNIPQNAENCLLQFAVKWYCNAVKRDLEEVAKCVLAHSNPVTQTSFLLRDWLNKANLGVLFYGIFGLVRYLSAVRIFYFGQAFLCLVFLFLQKAECSVHSFGYSRLCGLEHMRINIQSRSRIAMS